MIKVRMLKMKVRSYLSIGVVWVFVFLISFLSSSVGAEGNITASSGPLRVETQDNSPINLDAGTGQVISLSDVNVSGGKNIQAYDTNNEKNVRMYHTGTIARVQSDNEDLELRANETSTSNIQFYQKYASFYFRTDAEWATFYMIPSGDRHSMFYHQPANNASNNLALIFGYNDAERAGISVAADNSHDMEFNPWTNNQYDIGNPNRCWKTVYAYNFYDCGSPTEKFTSRTQALDAVETMAEGHLSGSVESYESMMPDEFKGEYGICEHNVTNVDEVINALVLSTSELNARIDVLNNKIESLKNELKEVEGCNTVE